MRSGYGAGMRHRKYQSVTASAIAVATTVAISSVLTSTAVIPTDTTPCAALCTVASG